MYSSKWGEHYTTEPLLSGKFNSTGTILNWKTIYSTGTFLNEESIAAQVRFRLTFIRQTNNKSNKGRPKHWSHLLFVRSEQLRKNASSNTLCCKRGNSECLSSFKEQNICPVNTVYIVDGMHVN